MVFLTFIGSGDLVFDSDSGLALGTAGGSPLSSWAASLKTSCETPWALQSGSSSERGGRKRHEKC